MATPSPEEEKDAVDLVTNAMFSISFLDTISKVLGDPKTNTVSLIDFYKWWLGKTSAKELKVPFSPGIFLGYLYCGLLVTKENWSDLLPTDPISKLDPAWGLGGVVCQPATKPDPPLPYFIRRLRNALGHANLSLQVPEGVPSPDAIHDLVTWTFRDINPRDLSDTFGVTLTMRQLEILVKAFQGLVHKHVRVKYAGGSSSP